MYVNLVGLAFFLIVPVGSASAANPEAETNLMLGLLELSLNKVFSPGFNMPTREKSL